MGAQSNLQGSISVTLQVLLPLRSQKMVQKPVFPRGKGMVLEVCRGSCLGVIKSSQMEL